MMLPIPYLFSPVARSRQAGRDSSHILFSPVRQTESSALSPDDRPFLPPADLPQIRPTSTWQMPSGFTESVNSGVPGPRSASKAMISRSSLRQARSLRPGCPPANRSSLLHRVLGISWCSRTSRGKREGAKLRGGGSVMVMGRSRTGRIRRCTHRAMSLISFMGCGGMSPSSMEVDVGHPAARSSQGVDRTSARDDFGSSPARHGLPSTPGGSRRAAGDHPNRTPAVPSHLGGDLRLQLPGGHSRSAGRRGLRRGPARHWGGHRVEVAV